MERRLAAILVADVVGYSRLMEQDETGTMVAWADRRKAILEPLVAKYRGRVVQFMGDGTLAEFASAVDAVQCAVSIQKAMKEANEKLSDARAIVLRIGVNLGDVAVDGGDLYGDGVNIAARLEAMADQICKMAEKAIRLDDSESISHSILSWVYLYQKSYDLAEFHSERALNLTPNRSQVLADQCELLTFLGRPLEAVVSLNRARQFDPFHPGWFWWTLGRVHYVAHQYADTNAAFAHVVNLPYFAHAYAAACHAQLGQPDLARSHANKVMQLRTDFSLHSFMQTEPFKQDSDTAHMLDGLRKAGLPENERVMEIPAPCSPEE